MPANEIVVLADSVNFGGVAIGSITGGHGETPLVVTFNENATLAAVQALIRNLTFANVSRERATNHRYVRLTLTDDTGQTSNLPIAHVLVDPRPVQPGILPGDFNGNGQVEQADLDLVLLYWGQDGGSLPSTWTGPPATGLVDQEELDAVLLNWGATTTAVSAAPAQAPLLAASDKALAKSAKSMTMQVASPCAGKKPIKSPYRLPSAFDEVLGDDGSPSTKSG